MQVFVPRELRDLKLEPVLLRFFDAMVYKLRRNKHKGAWERVDLQRALNLLKLEVAELEGAMKEGSQVEILMEAADIANFALIVSSIAIGRPQ